MALKLKKIALALSIVILLNIFVYTGIRTFYKQPDRTVYCGDIYSRGPLYTEQDCIAAGGQWIQPPQEPNVREKPGAYCAEKATCYKQYEDAIKPYNRNVFIIYVILGLISLLIGFLIKVDAIAAGLDFGAVVLLFTGTVRFWTDMQEYLRFVIVGLALAIVIWFGYKKMKA